MATVKHEIVVQMPAAQVWDAVRDVGNIHRRLVPGFVVDTVLEEGARVVTFANGLVVREAIVTCDDAERRLVWAIVNERLSHYNASTQVFEVTGGTRIVWIAELLPNERAPAISATIEAGLAAMKAHLDTPEATTPLR